MRFSKRSQPMDFGSPDEDPQAAEARQAHAEAVGFRHVDPVQHAHAVGAQGGRALAPQDEHHAYAAFEVDQRPPSGWPTWLIAVAVAVLWALAPIAFAVGYRNNVAPLQDDPFALTVFALLAIGPAIFVLGAAYMIRQGQKLAYETRRTKAMAEDMLAPALVAASRAGDVTMAVREEIVRAAAAAEEARETLIAMRDALAFETDKLTGVTAQSVRTAQELATTLGRERAEMSGLAQTLDTQATRVTDAIGQQARMITEATGVAETQIREAEAGLSARAADLAAAAGEATDAARTAGEDLTRHIARLETAGVGVADQVRAVESGLTEQRAALVSLSQTLKGDHEVFAANAEAHAATLGEFIAEARQSANEMSERALTGGDQLRRLMSDAALQFRDIAETAKAEREEFGQSTLQSLEAVSSAAADQRAQLEAQTRAAIDALAKAAEETRAAAARHATTAREQVDQLSEAAFSAGQKANQVFEARLEEAKALVEQSSKMVEDAGAATARKLEDGAAAARATLEELSAMMGEIEQRAAKMPAAAAGQADRVRATVADGMDELMAQARRTAEEAHAIDAAFQDRVRRNFEMLSEAVKLMGVAAVAPPAPAPVLLTPPPAPRKAKAAPPPEPEVAPEDDEPETLELATPVAPPAGAELADRIGLRNRIRLTPTATDREFSAVFEAAGGPPAASAPTGDGEEAEDGGETWTWKDLLASLDGADGEGERLEDALSAELTRMGVDPAKLLPAGRIEEIAAALQTGDQDGGREVVRKLAPAATRRIARRLFTDDDVKRRTGVYVRRYKTLVDDAVARDPSGLALAGLLGAEAGRVFLLLDAAAGDMI
ncbi:MAG: polar localization protein TipN [Alphaproteobacteria bacterium]|nr:polar localization protein TipN [Alphaproteobacteria bacterium]MBU2094864.1 polar localization protein TipN [Alphaproteobacteria bacterium]MBU2152770.1 polar localization protein TipN [Alphaproteobacteria bacterium]MBU2306321.1 polar localization protein TipN [Alphaproteobacteria bacterium]MBU2363550.1 polar localization protein TipN [Alphaproteobacteria bacterium]